MLLITKFNERSIRKKLQLTIYIIFYPKTTTFINAESNKTMNNCRVYQILILYFLLLKLFEIKAESPPRL